MTTIRQIAELAGVSSATVSKILNNKDQHISQKTRERVLKIVEEEGYIPNAIARSLKTRKTKTIGLIIPDVLNQYFSELARGVEDAAERNGYTLVLCNSDNRADKEENYIRILEENMIDGIILTASEQRTSSYRISRKTPIVLLDRDIDICKSVGKILVDNMGATYTSTNHLIEKSCSKIGYISCGSPNKLTRDRFLGYKKALLEAGLKVDEKIIYRGNYNVDTGYKGVQEILKESMVDGICCGNDLIAIGAMKALLEKGVKVPEDVKIIGIDDIEMSQYVNPSLTTMRQPVYEMGDEAVKMLVSIIENKNGVHYKVFKTELIERRSTYEKDLSDR